MPYYRADCTRSLCGCAVERHRQECGQTTRGVTYVEKTNRGVTDVVALDIAMAALITLGYHLFDTKVGIPGQRKVPNSLTNI